MGRMMRKWAEWRTRALSALMGVLGFGTLSMMNGCMEYGCPTETLNRFFRDNKFDGNDLLICSDPAVQLPAVIEAVKDGTISLEQVEESVLRILMWKLELNIIS